MTCPVCGKGELEPQEGFTYPRHVSHLACVEQADKTMRVAVEAHGRLEAENRLLNEARENANAATFRAEAKLAALKAQLDALTTHLIEEHNCDCDEYGAEWEAPTDPHGECYRWEARL